MSAGDMSDCGLVPPRQLDAARLFYHYLQKELLQNDIWLFQMLTARLVAALGIWLDPASTSNCH